MKPRVIREKILDEIRHDLSAAEENLRTLKFQLVTSQLEKTSQIRISKREISRLKTIIREHELDIHPVAAPEKAG